jgi:DNA-binding NarL/FixJ family response regulator
MIRVAVVDDHPLVRVGFAVLIRSCADLQFVGEAATGQDAVELARATKPDVMLMDVRMPGLNGIEATRMITTDPATASTRVLILTTFDLDEYAFAGLNAGASGFLLKDAEPPELIGAIRTVARGDAVIAPRVTRLLLDAFADQMPGGSPVTAPSPLVDRLTPRELQVLGEVAAGRSNPEIAARLVLSEATVKTHLGRILTKLELRDRVQAVVFAYRNQLVDERPD